MDKLISLCMIAFNEEEILQRCLDSVAGLWDELIVVVDSRTTDRTVEIAESYGATVLNYEWIAPGNKSAARNLGIDHAVSQWIVVVDADEVIRDAVGVRQAISKVGNDIDAARVQFRNYAGNQEQTLAWYQIRIFRRGKYRYSYREHEVPLPLAEGLNEVNSTIVFEHRVPEGRASTKNAPMLARLTADVDENPTHPHPLYFLHRECLNQGDYQRAIELGQRYLDLTKGGGYIQGDIYANLALAHQRLGAVSQARRNLHLAAAEEPQRREFWYRLGLLHFECQEWNLSLAMLRAATEIVPDQSRQWEPNTMAQVYDLIGKCQQEIAHALAHTHSH
jgi:glycosyltransferase involved in cell wall biosynthesis